MENKPYELSSEILILCGPVGPQKTRIFIAEGYYHSYLFMLYRRCLSTLIFEAECSCTFGSSICMIQIWKFFAIFQWHIKECEIKTPNRRIGAAFVLFLLEWQYKRILLLFHGLFTTVKAIQYRVPKYILLATSSWEGVTRWRSWLRHCAPSRKVAGSVPDGVIGSFYWLNSSSRTMALGSI